MKNRGAAGPDEVPPTFLKNIGNHAKTELLRVFNMSFREGVVPQVWRNAVIIPLLKSGKPANSIESYRPVSLTSCIVKLLERRIFHRLYNLWVWEKVWKEDLLLCWFESGVPLSFIRWIWAFLRNRQFRVLFNGSLSRTRWLIHGVPQVAVLSPMLFLFYINSVADVIPKDVLNSIFADDLTIWASDHNKKTAQWRVQEAVKHIESWCRSKKMLLSDKSVVTFFSAASCDYKWVPSLNMNNLPMKFDPAPKLLGIYMNRTLSFQQHVEYVVRKVEKRCNLLGCLGNTGWGWKKRPMRSVYLATQRSILDYAAPAWQPWISRTQMDRLERAQNQALRRITGQTASSPVEALRIEAGQSSYETISRQLIATSREKAFRCPPNHPRRLALEGEQRHRLCHTAGVRAARG